MGQPRLLIATRNPGKMQEYRELLRRIPYRLVSLDDVGITRDVEETGHSFEENAVLKARAYASLSGLLTLADDSGLEVDALGGEPGVHSARYGEDPPQPPPCKGEGEQTHLARGGEWRMSDQDRVSLLLRNLEGVPWERRTARFRCVIAVATPPPPPYQGGAQGGSPPYQGIRRSPLYQRGARGDLAPGRMPGPESDKPGDVTLVAGSVEGMIQWEPVGEGGFGYDPVFYLPSRGLTMAQIPLEEKNRISHRAAAARKAVSLLKLIRSGQPSACSSEEFGECTS